LSHCPAATKNQKLWQNKEYRKVSKAMVALSSEYRHRLPTVEELPCSDETPVDNELQNDIPNILLNLLRDIWGDSPIGNVASRKDWFFGVDMAVYYDPDLESPRKSKAVVPDGFLALGVKERPNEGGRLSYAIWEEGATPILFLEVISKERQFKSEVQQVLVPQRILHEEYDSQEISSVYG